MKVLPHGSRLAAIAAAVMAVAASGASTASAGTNAWTPLALPSSSLQVVGADPASGSIAGATVGSVYVGGEDASTWSRATPFDASELVYAPMNPGTVFAAVGNYPGGSILRSTDGGASWSASGVVAGNLVTADPGRTNIDWAAATGTTHVSRTADDGHSWLTASLSSTVTSNVAADPTQAGRLFVGTLAGVQRSTDGGATWSLATTSQLSVTTGGSPRWMAVGADGTAYAGTSTNGLWMSVDQGSSWTQLTSLPTSAITMVIADPAAAQHLVVDAGRDVYASSDGGQTWSTGSGLPPDGARAIAPVLTSSGSVLAATTDGVYEGSGDPLTFTKGPNQPPGAEVRQLVQAAPGSPTLYAATSGGIYRSGDFGTSWAQRVTGLPTWDTTVVAPDPDDPATALAVVHGAGLFRTADSGSSWAESDSGLVPTDLSAVVFDPTDPQVVYAASATAGVWTSADDGVTWAPCSGTLPSEHVSALAVSSTAPATVFAGDGSGDVETSTDGCATWTPRAGAKLPGAVSAIAVSPGAPLIVYAASASGLRRSDDGGASWSPVRGGSSTTLVVDAADPDRIWSGDATSSDGGTSWAPLGPPGLTQAFTVLSDPNDPARLVAGGSLDGAVTETLVAPSATTLPPTLDGSHVTLNGTVDGRQADATYHFEYGPTTAYGSATTPQSTGWSAPAQTAAVLLPISPGQTIHYRLVASSVAGTSTGADRVAFSPVPPAITRAPTATLRTGSVTGGRMPVRVAWDGTGGSGEICRWMLDRTTDPARPVRLASGPGLRSLDTAQTATATRYTAWLVPCPSAPPMQTVTRDGPASTATPIQQGAVALRYRGTWTVVHAPLDWGGAARTTRAAGASVRATLSGRGIAFVTTVGPAFGKARITVNGIARVVNLHARRTAHRRVVYVRNWAARGTHTITITALAGARIDIDALIALR